MPTVPKTSQKAIVAAARRIIKQKGVEALSMPAVAKAVRVQPPSLYKHVPDRAYLVTAVTRQTMAEAKEVLDSAATTGSAVDDIRAMFMALRGFAHRSPHLYALLFSPEADLGTEEYAAMVLPLLTRLKNLVGEADALSFARLLTAFAHGFISMELAGAFHLGGNLDEAFLFGLETILGGMGRRASAKR